jgi:recombinational DNA repair ATPase RecF
MSITGRATAGAIDRRRLEDLLAVYDPQLARLGAQVSAARQAFEPAIR